MNIKKMALNDLDVPPRLRNIFSPPDVLYTLGENLKVILKYPLLTVVGTRKVSPYGRQITTQLVGEAAQAGIGIISGLAIGVDGLAHQAALDNGAPTIAVLPCGIDTIYPRSHYNLAQNILKQGGVLVSEYPEGSKIAFKSNFIERNRLVAGLGDALLVTEATEKSGTMHTARFALEQGKTVLAVPGNITNPESRGTNNLIKSGAIPVTEVGDILHAMGINPQKAKSKPRSSNPGEQKIIDLIANGVSDGAELIALSGLGASRFNQSLTMLEIRGVIYPLGNNHWSMKF